MHDPVFDIFTEEAKEHLEALEKGFLDLEASATAEVRRGQIDNLFRHAHSLKGDARAIGLPALQDAGQQLEDILDGLRDNPEKVNRPVIDLGLRQFDVIRKAFEDWQRSFVEEKPDRRTQAAPETEPSTDLPSATGAAVAREPSEAVPMPVAAQQEESFTVRVPSERLDRMLNLVGELRITQRSGEDLNNRLTALSRFLADVFERCRLVEQMAAEPHTQSSVDRARGEREAQPLVREEIAEVRLQLEGCRDQVGRVVNVLRRKSNREDILLEALETDIQQARLLPLMMLADSLRRVVRELGQSLGKAIRYEVDVGSVLLDKAILEALREPMLHLIRNAASHGLEPAEERRAAGKQTAGGVARTPDAKTKGRILLVDDSPTTRTILRNVLTAAGYNIRTAADGVEALERLRVESVDLVVSDVEMPRMDGFELARQVKAKHGLPVILVTGLEKEEARRKGLEAGADAYLSKSTFQGEGLLEIVQQLV